MTKIAGVLLLFFISIAGIAQKSTLQVIKPENVARLQWQILDEKYNNVFSGDQNFRDDSVTFSLEANKRYILRVSVFEIYNPNSTLLILINNGEPIILIKSEIESGDHYYPFFTGMRTQQGKITGGTTALITDFPWQVFFKSGSFQCGGSIIAPNWILTAAHCTKDDLGNAIPATSMSVKVGANNPYNAAEGQVYSVSSVIVHEGYNDQTLLNDIALLKLSVPINNPIAIPIKMVIADDVAAGATDPGVLSTVTGWGLVHVSPDSLPKSLQKVQLPLVTNAQASTVWSSIPATDMMAGYLNGNKDACNGDSGGPLIVPVAGSFKVAGIVSWGSQACDTYGAYTRVSLFENWIRVNTGIGLVGDTLICNGVVSSQYTIGNVPVATVYQWKLTPSNAGTVSGNSTGATVVWNNAFTGTATLMLNITINNTVMEWTRQYLDVVPRTSLISQSGDTVICARQPFTLRVNAAGHSLSFKWFKDGNQIQSGPTPNFTVQSATTDLSGVYTCQISGSCGTLTSLPVNLTVHPLTKIMSISPEVEVPFGNDASITVVSQGFDLNYQWTKDNILLDNTNSSQLVLQNVNATNIGLYRVIVTGACGTEKSDSVYVYVKKANFTSDPEVFLWPSVTSEEFNVALSTNAIYNIRVYNTMGKIVKEITSCQYQTNIDVSFAAKGTYIVTVFNGSFKKSLKIIKY
jgi:secreted trypsin-like serine protease